MEEDPDVATFSDTGKPDYPMSSRKITAKIVKISELKRNDGTTSFFINNYTVDDITNAVLRSGQKAVEEQQRKGLPVAQYDFENKRAYLVFPDGRREYVNG